MKKNLNKTRNKTIKYNPGLLFYIYKKDKKDITALRAWFAARIIDEKGAGKTNIKELCRLIRIEQGYFEKKCLESGLFRKFSPSEAYYVSTRKLYKLFRLRKKIIRVDRLTAQTLKTIKSNKNFKGLITKCFFEMDLDKKFQKITVGRISVPMAAAYFNVSENTIRSSLKRVNTKRYDNIKHYPRIRFKNKQEFGKWLLNNMDKRIDGHCVSENPRSYFPLKTKNDYYLCQRRPFIFKLTAVYLYVPKPRKRGKSANKQNLRFSKEGSGTFTWTPVKNKNKFEAVI